MYVKLLVRYPFVRQEKGRTDFSPHQIYEPALPGDLGLDPVGERHRVLALMPPHRRKVPGRTDIRLGADVRQQYTGFWTPSLHLALIYSTKSTQPPFRVWPNPQIVRI